MSEEQTRDVSEAVLPVMTEAELANWQRSQGTKVICHRDRHWKQTYLGFYQPIHLLARLSSEQATCPAFLHWGFQATLCEADAANANASMPVHLLTNLKDYDVPILPSKRRTQLRKCQRLVEIVELTGSRLLQEQGYEVMVSTVTRTGYGNIPSKQKYMAGLVDYVTPGRRLILAGLINDKLGGYLTGYVVNDTAYMEDLIIATEVLSTNIVTGLVFEFVQICRRSGLIREVYYGLHSREDSALCVFKEGMGFPVKHIPTQIEMNQMIGKFIRWRYPDKYYRLTGRE
ncbi:hypothetical protein [Microcoleus sp.]|uniref:hypothetical protein n=1 Tax=Microcoleus sp. TaxID=44472 RepID=UPI00403E9175